MNGEAPPPEDSEIQRELELVRAAQPKPQAPQQRLSSTQPSTAKLLSRPLSTQQIWLLVSIGISIYWMNYCSSR